MHRAFNSAAMGRTPRAIEIMASNAPGHALVGRHGFGLAVTAIMVHMTHYVQCTFLRVFVSKSNEQLVMDFFHAMGPTVAEVIAAYETFMHPDALWRNSGMPDLVGIDQITHLIREQNRLLKFDQVRILDIFYLGSVDDRVFFERKDALCDAAGNSIFELDILGMFIIRDGKISAWHDYMDMSAMLHATAPKAQ